VIVFIKGKSRTRWMAWSPCCRPRQARSPSRPMPGLTTTHGVSWPRWISRPGRGPV